ncbi:MAG: DEAD/DEAH box helicase [Gammaproteobacteria bacterium]|nr:DEAD/DEAH box helicase [Gammaproteobacteria bacterium]
MENINASRMIAPASLSASSLIPAPPELQYLDFQKAGIDLITKGFLNGAKSRLLADPQGVGKTIQAIGVTNYMMLHPMRVLVICPASLRINWQREIDKWSVWDLPTMAILKGNQFDRIQERQGSLVISYDLTLNQRWAYYLMSQPWDVLIFDEAQNLKNVEAKRTVACLQKIAPAAKHVLLLSGTPIPNRAHEFYSYLHDLAPEVIGDMTMPYFNNRYTTGHYSPYGWQITGGRNHHELSNRLRGTGWMIRRDKRSVLPQLPPERHIMAVLPQDAGTARVVKKEQVNCPFTAQEILDAGQPMGYGAVPELRHEMGLEKVPACLKWVMNQLEGGTDNIVLFGYHQDVLEQVFAGLKKYNPVMVYGPTSQVRRQAAVDRFQTDPECRVIIGGWKPLGTGWTLTAADTVAFIEASFVPGDNDQCKDRCIRYDEIFIHAFISVYYLVVEGSVDATVLSRAADKAHDTGKVVN